MKRIALISVIALSIVLIGASYETQVKFKVHGATYVSPDTNDGAMDADTSYTISTMFGCDTVLVWPYIIEGDPTDSLVIITQYKNPCSGVWSTLDSLFREGEDSTTSPSYRAYSMYTELRFIATSYDSTNADTVKIRLYRVGGFEHP